MARKALLVGINDYQPEGYGGPDLKGCINDVQDMAHTLNALGIVPAEPKNMRIITNTRATKTNIIEGLNWLIKDVKKEDALIFYFSGHGSRVLDLDGDEEIDGMDETLCPYDYATNGMITDDVIHEVLQIIGNEINLDVIIDSCHAGTITRGIETCKDVPPEKQTTCKYIEPPVDDNYFMIANPTIPVRGILKPIPVKKEDIVVSDLNHVLWAACRDNQISEEAFIEGKYRGVFTYCFCKALRRAGTGIIRRKLANLVSVDVREMGFLQVPQLEGTNESLDENVFT